MNDIVLICDDAYAMPTMVCIQSIINHAEINAKTNVHVCTFNLSEENIWAFKKMSTERTAISVHIVPPNMIEKKIKRISQKTHVTTTALIKLELPNYFSELDRVLYLDSDVIVKGSIKSLLNMDIEDVYLAATFDYWVHFNNIRYKFYKDRNEEFYFNSGVMLLNLKKMREDHIPERLWEYKLNSAKTNLMDQECLNVVCHSSVKPLSIKWNFNPDFLHADHVKGFNKVYHEEYLNIDQVLSDVRIIHYVGKKDKPWVYESGKLRDYWQREFELLDLGSTLNLKSCESKRRNIIVSSIDKIRQYGFIGFVCFIRYSIQKKFRSGI